MTISANFSVTRDQIILNVLKECGAFGTGETPSSEDIADATFAFNLMIKAWVKGGMPLWKVTEVIVPMLANQYLYSIGPSAVGVGALVVDRPLRILDAFIRTLSTGTPNQDTPLWILSRQEYEQFGSKTQGSIPNSIYYQPLIPNGLLTTYPPPSISSVYEIHLFVQVPISDIINSTDTPDFPSECYQALKWNLCQEIAGPYVSSELKLKRIDMFAARYKMEMENWSQEEASIYFGRELDR